MSPRVRVATTKADRWTINADENGASRTRTGDLLGAMRGGFLTPKPESVALASEVRSTEP
jgi:hypothetical protein